MNIRLPELGEGIDSVEVTDILVKKGTSVKENDVLIVIESDKASMEIPAETPGTIIDILINKGDSLKPGDTIIKMDIEGESDQVLTADKDEAEPEQELKEEIKKEKVEIKKAKRKKL